MIKGFKLELYRAFHNTYYYIALIMGCAIAVAHFVVSVLPKTHGITGLSNIEYPWSVFNSCMPLDMTGYMTEIFYYAIVLIATLPFGMSYYTDLRGGYIKNIYTRMNAKGYLFGKYIAVFLSAGTICVIPLILNTLLTMAALPALCPQVGTMQFPIRSSAMLCQLYYTYPFAYLGIYFIIDFVVIGLFACMALTVSKWVYNRYLVLFTPFILFFLMQTVFTYTEIPQAAPWFLLLPIQPHWQKPYIVIAEILILFIISFSTFYFGGGKKHDTL